MPRGEKNQKITDEEFIRLFPAIGEYGIARKYEMAPQKMHQRRRPIILPVIDRSC